MSLVNSFKNKSLSDHDGTLHMYEKIQVVDGVVYFFFISGLAIVGWLAVNNIIRQKSFYNFRLVIFYIVLVAIYFRYIYIVLIECFPPYLKNSLYRLAKTVLFTFLLSRLLMYTSYSLLLLLWVRLYENVFKVKEAIFTLNHYGSYILIIIHLVFLAIYIPIISYAEETSIYRLFYKEIYIIFMIVYAGLLGIGFLVYGTLLWRDSIRTGKVKINNRILIISGFLFTLILMLNIYLICAYVGVGAGNDHIYRLIDCLSFIILMIGISVLLSRNPANRAKSTTADSGSSNDGKKPAEIQMENRQGPNSTPMSNADGIYSVDIKTKSNPTSG